MKEFFKKLKDEIIPGFITRLKEDRKFLFTVLGIAAAVIIAIVVIIVVCVKGSEIKPDPGITVDSTQVTFAPNATPTPSPSPEPGSEPTATPTPSPSPTPTPDLHIGEVRSELDGGWIKEEIANKRPFCAMLNNIIYANPQSGVGEAKILYEALVEGGITRLMGVYEGVDENSSCATRLGSIRSARHYYVSVATEYDAIYVHFGGAYYAYDKMEEMGIKDNMDGMSMGGDVFYRDKNIESPHNAFFSFVGAYQYLEDHKRRTEHKEGYTPNHFVFNDEQLYPADNSPVYNESGEVIPYAGPEATPAYKVLLSYDRWTQPYMLYDPETQLYNRYQFGGIHIDYNTQQPLTFTNIIIQIVHEWDKDRNDYQDMDLTDTSGKGYYISKGQCVPITWKKNEKAGFMMYYGSDGEVLSINPGKTFISLFPDFRTDYLSIEAQQNE
ncbi:MAG: DUF3048 domain-containing protein [Lachnospiraceae bacterium]|nr:DUF3048 domain-containing protein [Lachnospiraceae bacterium]